MFMFPFFVLPIMPGYVSPGVAMLTALYMGMSGFSVLR